MAVDINQTQKKPGMIEGNLGTIGRTVGSIWGPVGGIVGGMVGDAASGKSGEQIAGGSALDLLRAKSGGASAPVVGGGAGAGGSGGVEPSPAQPLASNSGSAVDRWQQNQLNLTALNQGMKALESNPSLKQSFAPLLSDTMKRAQGGMA
jgi:hypothetical protein